MSKKNLALNFDAVIIGSGIQGLLLAKRLLDYGQRVAILERASTIAKGSSSKNHGWLHQGTTHSLSAKDGEQAELIARQLQYGHAFYKTYAPECFDEPVLNSYAVTNDADRAEYARQRWQHSNVPFKELSAEEFFRLEPEINHSAVSYFFQVADSRINNRLLFTKLLTELTAKQAVILTEANYEYLNDYELLVMAKQGEYTLKAPLFFYATGAGTEAAHQKLMHTSLGVECFKSQLLFLPKISRHSVIDIDYSSPIIVNHGEISAVNRSHDDVVSDGTEPVVDEKEVERTLSSLAELYPSVKKLRRDQITAVACLKPCIPMQADQPRLHVDASTFEPKPGHHFVLPGKMTAAPYVTDNVIRQVAPKLNLRAVTPRPYEMPAETPATSTARGAGRRLRRPSRLRKLAAHSNSFNLF